ncbi:MAG: hypothetical protein H7333_06895 [Bdellovibrionales bacterium]|nr:hypothetical protein [Oligoflexia bacterium]
MNKALHKACLQNRKSEVRCRDENGIELGALLGGMIVSACQKWTESAQIIGVAI